MAWSPTTRNLFTGVNRPLDGRNLTDLERMHMPAIEAPAHVHAGEPFQVRVRIGYPSLHPSERSHFIGTIDLCADELVLARADLRGGNALPDVVFRACLTEPVTELQVRGQCNLHGTWGGSVALHVETGRQESSGSPTAAPRRCT